MRRLLLALPVVVLVAAAADTLFVRERMAHRELDPALFLESALLWLVFALIALLPVRWWLARRERAGRAVDATMPAVTLAFFTVAPVLAHWRLDAFSDLGGGLAGLKTPWPWLEVAGALAALWLVLFGLRQLAKRVRPSWIGVALSVASIALGLFANPWHEGKDDSTAAAQGKPNLLLLIWDTTRAQSLSFYGYDKATTPHLEQLARESMVFDMARSASRYTLTSHLSMLTGVYPSHHGARMTRQRISPR
ncbi:MAG: sulfatase-like hydrolase/transferase, partial [Planctomycetota bacterium]